MVRQGSKWSNSSGAVFHVINRVELEGNVWIHYIKENANDHENREFSCYEESFLVRFTEQPE